MAPNRRSERKLRIKEDLKGKFVQFQAVPLGADETSQPLTHRGILFLLKYEEHGTKLQTHDRVSVLHDDGMFRHWPVERLHDLKQQDGEADSQVDSATLKVVEKPYIGGSVAGRAKLAAGELNGCELQVWSPETHAWCRCIARCGPDAAQALAPGCVHLRYRDDSVLEAVDLSKEAWRLDPEPAEGSAASSCTGEAHHAEELLPWPTDPNTEYTGLCFTRAVVGGVPVTRMYLDLQDANDVAEGVRVDEDSVQVLFLERAVRVFAQALDDEGQDAGTRTWLAEVPPGACDTKRGMEAVVSEGCLRVTFRQFAVARSATEREDGAGRVAQAGSD